MRRRGFRRGDTDGRILPLINVVFLLLVFFMVAGRLAPPDPFALTPPQARADGPAPQGIVVAIAADGQVAVDGQRVDLTALAAAVEAARSALPGESVALRADARAPARDLAIVLARLRAAGVTEARLATWRR